MTAPLLVGLLLTLCGMVGWVVRAALLKVVGCGFGLLILVSVTLTIGPIRNHALRWAAGAPIRTAILMGLVLLVIACCRFTLKFLVRPVRKAFS